MAAQPGIATVSVALFASGAGSNAAALLDHRYAGAVRPRYRCLIGNNSEAPVMALARAHGVPAYHVSGHTHPHRDAYLARLTEILTRHGTELIVLAGYMKLLPGEIVRRWRGRVLNIHPALLPRHGGRGMYGMAPHRAVLAAGERETGVTVHLVDEEYDRGPIVLQRRVPVRPGDTAEALARRVLAVEHDTYWRAVERAAARLAARREGAADAPAPAVPAGEPPVPRAPGTNEHDGAGTTQAAPGAPGSRMRGVLGSAPAEPAGEQPAPGSHCAKIGRAAGTGAYESGITRAGQGRGQPAPEAPYTEVRESGTERAGALP